MGKLDGKVACIFGAAGKDNMMQVTARRMMAEGAKVMVTGRKEAELKAFAADSGASYVLCDITKKADVEAAANATIAKYGKVDIAVNGTGVGLLAPLLETTEEQIDMMMDLQFKGPHFFFQVFTEAMKDHGGSVMQVTSATTDRVIDNHAAYIGTKAGADALMRCFANEFGKFGIKYNSIAPGLTATPMTSGAMGTPGLEEAFRKKYPLGRIGTSEDIAGAAVWLASDESFITGEVLHITGGLRLRSNPSQEDIQTSVGAAVAALKAK